MTNDLEQSEKSDCNAELAYTIASIQKCYRICLVYLPLRLRYLLKKNRLQNKDGEQVKTSINFCRKLGYTDNDILKTPGLLRITPLELEQHYLTLEEGGFHSIGPKILVRARNYMKRVIKSLKTSKVISETTNVPEEFLRHIQDPEIVKKNTYT
ncbi:hypothetical protein NQ315_013951 [Exocentrus adspersus]|uniref:Uncharacterized protein n=1 Tax=Exocentrus adspersus TaxID=1586481 RepID=A0AAV8VRZ9_9CUCU|nr:hypothetical protein NQ315_013951 [Exocentrus adspersus]